MDRPKPIPVEKYFNEFVEEFGGELISKLMPQGQNLPKNADYLFRKDQVVCELKCLEKDLFYEDDADRLLPLIDKWTSNGMITGHQALRWVLGQDRLNEGCYRDLLTLVNRTIERAIRSAKHQIKDTKDFFNIPEASGLVLIANDGNYFLEHQQFIGLICNLMERRFNDSSIDGFVYFTANMPVSIPGHKLEKNIWVPGYREDNNIILGDFVNDIGEKWGYFYQNKIGQDKIAPTQIEDFDESIDLLNSMKLIKEYRKFNK